MAQITAALVKELREKTGAGMMDCKKALAETDGDIEAAIDWLRQKGLSAAAKKSGRVAADGLVGVAVAGNKAAVVEVNSETDFVARNETFQEFVGEIAKIALETGGDVDAINGAAYPGTSRTVAEQTTHNIATIGENMTFRRAAVLSVGNGVVNGYVHGAVVDGLGKIGVLVALESTGDAARVGELARELAMHVAATAPQSIDVDDLSPDAIEREKEVQRQTARESGKPEEIIEKMITGRMRKFYEEVCLVKQSFVKDPDQSVEKIIAAVAKEIGAEIKVVAFERFALGEGIEKQETDFAAEVAAAAGI